MIWDVEVPFPHAKGLVSGSCTSPEVDSAIVLSVSKALNAHILPYTAPAGGLWPSQCQSWIQWRGMGQSQGQLYKWFMCLHGNWGWAKGASLSCLSSCCYHAVSLYHLDCDIYMERERGGCVLLRRWDFFREVTRHSLFGLFPLPVDRHSLVHSIYIPSPCQWGSGLKEEDVVLPSSSFLRGSVFTKNSLQFNNQTVFSITVDARVMYCHDPLASIPRRADNWLGVRTNCGSTWVAPSKLGKMVLAKEK